MTEMDLDLLDMQLQKDKMLFAGSETGMIELNERKSYLRADWDGRNNWGKN